MTGWTLVLMVVKGNKREIKKFKDYAKGKDRFGKNKILNEDMFVPEKYEKLDTAVRKLVEEYKSKKEIGELHFQTIEDETRGEWIKRDLDWNINYDLNPKEREEFIDRWIVNRIFYEASMVEEKDSRLAYYFATPETLIKVIKLISEMRDKFEKLNFMPLMTGPFYSLSAPPKERFIRDYDSAIKDLVKGYYEGLKSLKEMDKEEAEA